jgi:hypothetical protein
MAYRLIISAAEGPNGHGGPVGLFYEDTPAGHAAAEAFAKKEDRPGRGVFDSICTYRRADVETFHYALRANGIPFKA